MTKGEIVPTAPRVIDLTIDSTELSVLQPVRWALAQLEATARSAGMTVRRGHGVGEVTGADVRVVLTESGSEIGRQALAGAGLSVPGLQQDNPEGFALAVPDGTSGRIVVVADAAAGSVYGLLELADVIALSPDPIVALRSMESSQHAPAATLRSILRPFVSVAEDTDWFHDREFWTEYLTELATNRINRFQLALGMQYNYGHDPASDNYFCFPYPFLLDLPGYDVYAEGVSAPERARNLGSLRFIGDECKRRGIHFQLGLWNHAYDQGEGSNPRYPIHGLNPRNHAEYCAVALATLLRECPGINGLTMRVHYEGGIPEPDHARFWQTVMTATTEVDRPIELDMHAKGVDQELLEIARDTGQPVAVSAKYWAEHWGLPYHQTSIRERERARERQGPSLMSITANERRFTRYGYGDFLREGRDFDLDFRIWPGGQRVLLWGDPVLGAGFGRWSTIGGARGAELCEPLSFKGRRDTGTPGNRDPYADSTLKLDGHEWRKYRYTYRLWGRLLYDPDANPDQWRRLLNAQYGPAAEAVEAALAPASRIIPLVTVVHGIGGSNGGYWPEMYRDMPIVEGPHAEHYAFDTPAPPRFGTVVSFDSSMFPSVDEFADDMLAGRRDGRYSPLEVAQWLDFLAEDAQANLERAHGQAVDASEPEFRRMAVDVSALIGMGRYFAGKFRAALAFALYQRTNDVAFLDEALAAYRSARAAYGSVAEVTTGVYTNPLMFGTILTERGHWADRLPAIDTDLAAMERVRAEAEANNGEAMRVPEVPRAKRPELGHQPPIVVRRGANLELAVIAPEWFDGTVELRYRHLNQGEDFAVVEMARAGDQFTAVVPGSYTDAEYPLQYYFLVRDPSGDAWVWPGLDTTTFANQPYYVVRQA